MEALLKAKQNYVKHMEQMCKEEAAEILNLLEKERKAYPFNSAEETLCEK